MLRLASAFQSILRHESKSFQTYCFSSTHRYKCGSKVPHSRETCGFTSRRKSDVDPGVLRLASAFQSVLRHESKSFQTYRFSSTHRYKGGSKLPALQGNLRFHIAPKKRRSPWSAEACLSLVIGPATAYADSALTQLPRSVRIRRRDGPACNHMWKVAAGSGLMPVSRKVLPNNKDSLKPCSPGHGAPGCY